MNERCGKAVANIQALHYSSLGPDSKVTNTLFWYSNTAKSNIEYSGTT